MNNIMLALKVKLNLITSLILMIFLIGCATTEVKTTKVTPVILETAEIPESSLLDIGIQVFDPGLDKLEQLDDDAIYFPEIRIAEASYFPYLLMETLQTSSAWGAVRVIPQQHDSVDVLVKGEIIQSDGELLTLKVTASDATGQHWFTKDYTQKASRYSYDSKMQLLKEPFQNIYNQITNDLYFYQKKLSKEKSVKIRQISELKFAQSFSPNMFSEHLKQDKSGIITVNRLPAEGDPMMDRIKQIRERDYLFVDTLQEYYGHYVKGMKAPYQTWRSESYQEVIAMRTMQRKATNQKLIGAASIIAGIFAAGNSSGATRAAGAIAVAGGSYIIKDGFDRDAESQIHIEALQELGDSLEANLETHVIELEDRTVTLTGTVDNQYQQWREILKGIYKINVAE
ncbi:hypothetical protein [Pseudoalteromonas denitrificans]|uniref:Uncharacterized protein n=1 Tax=Pseudoalteromonas denitrificans DSM 6059 TaxID=1123010 RepID=A0A1I1FHU3_9GAMM|nr:hypothetical protein [Pseudoalteromonas denitrificans]SFB98977.1 hypothetical protein SAMN02745724_00645 [Pseudoalteromonas denitrificans DSM 6059]